MHTQNCPKCGTAKTKLAPRRGMTDHLLGTLTIYPVRCQLCTHRFTTFLGKLKPNPRRNYDRVSVQYPAEVRPIHDPSQRVVVEGILSNLSLRGCRVRTNQRIPMGCQVMLEFHPAEYDDPIMVDGAIVRSPLCRRDRASLFQSPPLGGTPPQPPPCPAPFRPNPLIVDSSLSALLATWLNERTDLFRFRIRTGICASEINSRAAISDTPRGGSPCCVVRNMLYSPCDPIIPTQGAQEVL